jgi:hypothetical protein
VQKFGSDDFSFLSSCREEHLYRLSNTLIDLWVAVANGAGQLQNDSIRRIFGGLSGHGKSRRHLRNRIKPEGNDLKVDINDDWKAKKFWQQTSLAEASLPNRSEHHRADRGCSASGLQHSGAKPPACDQAGNATHNRIDHKQYLGHLAECAGCS